MPYKTGIIPSPPGLWAVGHASGCTGGLSLHTQRISPPPLPIPKENASLAPNPLALPCDILTAYPASSQLFFLYYKSVLKSEIVNARYRQKMDERKLPLQSVKAEHWNASAERDILKAEIINVLRGESVFSKEILSSMVAEAETKVARLQERLDEAQRSPMKKSRLFWTLSMPSTQTLSPGRICMTPPTWRPRR